MCEKESFSSNIDDFNLDFLNDIESTPNPQFTFHQEPVENGLSTDSNEINSKQKLARRIASTNELVQKIHLLQNELSKKNQQFTDIKETAGKISQLYESEKKNRLKLQNDVADLETQKERLHEKVLDYTLNNDQLKAKLADKEGPVSFRQLAQMYLRLVHKSEPDTVLNSDDRQLIKKIHKFCKEKKIKVPEINILKSPRKPKETTSGSSQKSKGIDQEVQCDLNQIRAKVVDQETQYENLNPITKDVKETKDQAVQCSKQATVSRGTQHRPTTATRSTSFPEPVRSPVINNILKEMLGWTRIQAIAPIPELQETAPQTRNVGSCTDICNIQRKVDFLPIIKLSNSRPPSRLANDVKQEIHTPLSSPLMSTFNEHFSKPINVPPQLRNLKNVGALAFEELWQVFGNLLLSLIQDQGESRAQSHQQNESRYSNDFFNWLRSVYDSMLQQQQQHHHHQPQDFMPPTESPKISCDKGESSMPEQENDPLPEANQDLCEINMGPMHSTSNEQENSSYSYDKAAETNTMSSQIEIADSSDFTFYKEAIITTELDEIQIESSAIDSLIAVEEINHQTTQEAVSPTIISQGICSPPCLTNSSWKSDDSNYTPAERTEFNSPQIVSALHKEELSAIDELDELITEFSELDSLISVIEQRQGKAKEVSINLRRESVESKHIPSTPGSISAEPIENIEEFDEYKDHKLNKLESSIESNTQIEQKAEISSIAGKSINNSYVTINSRRESLESNCTSVGQTETAVDFLLSLECFPNNQQPKCGTFENVENALNQFDIKSCMDKSSENFYSKNDQIRTNERVHICEELLKMLQEMKSNMTESLQCSSSTSNSPIKETSGNNRVRKKRKISLDDDATFKQRHFKRPSEGCHQSQEVDDGLTLESCTENEEIHDMDIDKEHRHANQPNNHIDAYEQSSSAQKDNKCKVQETIQSKEEELMEMLGLDLSESEGEADLVIDWKELSTPLSPCKQFTSKKISVEVNESIEEKMKIENSVNRIKALKTEDYPRPNVFPTTTTTATTRCDAELTYNQENERLFHEERVKSEKPLNKSVDVPPLNSIATKTTFFADSSQNQSSRRTSLCSNEFTNEEQKNENNINEIEALEYAVYALPTVPTMIPLSVVWSCDHQTTKQGLLHVLLGKYSYNEQTRIQNVQTKNEMQKKNIVFILSTQINQYLNSYIENIIFETSELVTNMHIITEDISLIVKAIIAEVQLIPNSGVSDSVAPPLGKQYWAASNTRVETLLRHLHFKDSQYTNEFLVQVDSLLFNTNSVGSSSNDMIINLTQLYLFIISNYIPSNYSSPPTRTFLGKCLYFYRRRLSLLVYELLMCFPTTLPPREETAYDRSDAIITVCQHLLMTTKYEMEGENFRNKELLSMLRFKYHFEAFKPLRDDVLRNLVNKLKAGKLTNLQYAFAIFCKYYSPDYVIKEVLQNHLVPLAREYYDLMHETTAYDERIVTLLNCISITVKPFPLETDVTMYFQIITRFLHAVERPIIQESAVQAILRLQRFSHESCYLALYNFHPVYRINARTLTQLKTFIHSKPLKFWRSLETRHKLTGGICTV